MEVARAQGELLLFTGSRDGAIKAWRFLDRGCYATGKPTPNKAIEQLAEKPLAAAIHALALVGEELLVAGLATGALAGWNLTQDNTEQLPLGPAAITAMHRHGDSLITADATGAIMVRPASQIAELLLRGQRQAPPAQNPR